MLQALYRWRNILADYTIGTIIVMVQLATVERSHRKMR